METTLVSETQIDTNLDDSERARNDGHELVVERYRAMNPVDRHIVLGFIGALQHEAGRSRLPLTRACRAFFHYMKNEVGFREFVMEQDRQILKEDRQLVKRFRRMVEEKMQL